MQAGQCAEHSPQDRLAAPERLAAVAAALEGGADPALDALASLVRRLLHVPVAMVTLVTQEEQRFPGQSGLPAPLDVVRATPIGASLCQFVVVTDAPLVVPDAAADPRLAEHPAVTRLGARSYAGMPLRDEDGAVLGSLCAIDRVPRAWTEDELGLLRDLATTCSSELRLRIAASRAAVATRALAQLEAQWRLTFAHGPVGMALTEPEGRVLQVNRALCQLLGRTPEEVAAAPPDALVHPEDAAVVVEQFRSLRRGDADRFTTEVRLLHADGSPVWVDLSVALVTDVETGEPSHVVAHVQDSTERRRRTEALARLAMADPLTGLLNRRAFLDRLARAMATARREGGQVGVVYVDLDGFKRVNDLHGHAAGDAVLHEVASRMTACLRGGDTVARLGGDEFAVLCEAPTGTAALEHLSARLASALRQPCTLADGTMLPVGASLGTAVSGPARATPDALLRAADAAMYAAKRR